MKAFTEWSTRDMYQWCQKRWYQLYGKTMPHTKLIVVYSRLSVFRERYGVALVLLAMDRAMKNGLSFSQCLSDYWSQRIINLLDSFHRSYAAYVFLATIRPELQPLVTELQDYCTSDLPNPGDEERVRAIIAALGESLVTYERSC